MSRDILYEVKKKKRERERERERENLLGEEKAGVGGGWINTYASKKKKKKNPA